LGFWYKKFIFGFYGYKNISIGSLNRKIFYKGILIIISFFFGKKLSKANLNHQNKNKKK